MVLFKQAPTGHVQVENASDPVSEKALTYTGALGVRIVTVLTLRSEVSVSDRNVTDRTTTIWYRDTATMLKQTPTDHVRVENTTESDLLRPDAQRLDGLLRRKNEVRSARARS